MRKTSTIDDATLREAERITGVGERRRLIQKALEALIAQEKARRLAALGGTEKNLRAISRRRAS
jgi:Arc/MetJ family transcription regulator